MYLRMLFAASTRAPVRHGVWLFPPAGAGCIDWCATDTGDAAGESVTVRISGVCTAERIDLTVEVEGALDQPLGLVLPAGEGRPVSLAGPAVPCPQAMF